MNGKSRQPTNGQELKEKILELGLTISEFSRESDISITSLKKIFANRHVRGATRNKAWIACQRLERRLKGLAEPPNAGAQVS